MYGSVHWPCGICEKVAPHFHVSHIALLKLLFYRGAFLYTYLAVWKYLTLVVGVVISRSCMIAADCIAVGVTWFTLSRRGGLGHADAMLKGTISNVLLIDGEHCLAYLVVISHD